MPFQLNTAVKVGEKKTTRTQVSKKKEVKKKIPARSRGVANESRLA